MSASPPYPTEAQGVRLNARRLAEEAFQEAERRFGRGIPFEQAKQQVLEERVPGYLASYGDEITDLVIHSVMSVTETATNPYLRRANRKPRWKALLQDCAARGQEAPTRLDKVLFDWFGRLPREHRKV